MLCTGWQVTATPSLYIHDRRFVPERQKWPCQSAVWQNKKCPGWPTTVLTVLIFLSLTAKLLVSKYTLQVTEYMTYAISCILRSLFICILIHILHILHILMQFIICKWCLYCVHPVIQRMLSLRSGSALSRIQTFYTFTTLRFVSFCASYL